MTLIIKELVIRGVVKRDNSKGNSNEFSKSEIKVYMNQLQKEMERNCVEAVISKLESVKSR